MRYDMRGKWPLSFDCRTIVALAVLVCLALFETVSAQAICDSSIHNATSGEEQNLTAVGNLPSNWKCTWNLEAPTGYIIKLTFKRNSPYMGTAINCNKGSFIEIRDGKDTSTQLVKKSCQGTFWNNFPLDKPFYSFSNHLKVTFSSGTYEYAQIVVLYKAVKPAEFASCRSSQSLDTNLNILVGGYLGNVTVPAAKMECLWRISAPPNHIVKVILPKLPCPNAAGLQFMVYDGIYGMSEPAMQEDKSCIFFPQPLETVYSTGRYLSIRVRTLSSKVPEGTMFSMSAVKQEQTGSCGFQSTKTSLITINGKEGSVFVPKYGTKYKYWGVKRDCSWTIQVPSDHIVKLQFNKLSNMNDGYLEVKDGREDNSGELFKFCDLSFSESNSQSLPRLLYSSGPYLQLRLNYKTLTASPLPWNGFLASFEAVSKVPSPSPGICSENNTAAMNNDIRLEGSSGSFRTPNYPMKYPRAISCTWKITAPVGRKVKLSFKKGGSVGFKRRDCLFWKSDYLEFRDGLTADNSEIRTKFCGEDIPTVESSSRDMWVRFVSNCKGDSGDVGFEAYYETELTGGAIAFTVVLVLAVVIFVAVVLFCVWRKKRARSADTSSVSYKQAPIA